MKLFLFLLGTLVGGVLAFTIGVFNVVAFIAIVLLGFIWAGIEDRALRRQYLDAMKEDTTNV